MARKTRKTGLTKAATGETSFAYTLRALGIVLALFGLLILGLWGLGPALTPLVVSFFLAYLIYPVIVNLEKSGVSRSWAAGLMFVFITALFIGVFLLFIPPLIQEVQQFIRDLPQTLASLGNRVESWLASLGYSIDISRESIRERFENGTENLGTGAIGSISDFVTGAISGVAGIVLGILNLFLIPLFFFYVMVDYEKIRQEIRELIPRSLKPKLHQYFQIANRVLSGFIRGQLLVALILAILNALGLWLIGVPYGLAIGAVAGILSFIPYVGTITGYVTAIAVSLAAGKDMTFLLIVSAFYGAVQVLEGYVISPKLVGNKVGLSSFMTILVLIIGGNLYGVLGMILAIPVAGILKHVFADLKSEYLKMQV